MSSADGRRNLLAAGRSPEPGDLAGREDIERLVRDFYRHAAVDELLGPVFAAVGTDWSEHIPRLMTFWSWQLLGDTRFDGQPLRAHERASAVIPFTEAHYGRWIELFDETVDAHWAGPVAELAKHRARKMAGALRRHLGERADRT